MTYYQYYVYTKLFRQMLGAKIISSVDHIQRHCEDLLAQIQPLLAHQPSAVDSPEMVSLLTASPVYQYVQSILNATLTERFSLFVPMYSQIYHSVNLTKDGCVRFRVYSQCLIFDDCLSNQMMFLSDNGKLKPCSETTYTQIQDATPRTLSVKPYDNEDCLPHNCVPWLAYSYEIIFDRKTLVLESFEMQHSKQTEPMWHNSNLVLTLSQSLPLHEGRLVPLWAELIKRHKIQKPSSPLRTSPRFKGGVSSTTTGILQYDNQQVSSRATGKTLAKLTTGDHDSQLTTVNQSLGEQKKTVKINTYQPLKYPCESLILRTHGNTALFKKNDSHVLNHHFSYLSGSMLENSWSAIDRLARPTLAASCVRHESTIDSCDQSSCSVTRPDISRPSCIKSPRQNIYIMSARRRLLSFSPWWSRLVQSINFFSTKKMSMVQQNKTAWVAVGIKKLLLFCYTIFLGCLVSYRQWMTYWAKRLTQVFCGWFIRVKRWFNRLFTLCFCSLMLVGTSYAALKTPLADLVSMRCLRFTKTKQSSCAHEGINGCVKHAMSGRFTSSSVPSSSLGNTFG